MSLAMFAIRYSSRRYPKIPDWFIWRETDSYQERSCENSSKVPNPQEKSVQHRLFQRAILSVHRLNLLE